MEWYSVNKYKPHSSYGSNYLVRYTHPSNNFSSIEMATYDDNVWTNKDDYEPIEQDGFVVTHFCIPKPIEIEHEETKMD